ncbi:TetR/AcrR family transcriptional regulator [Streptomyces rapamycinicus]|uniref:TetR family transcriptional regulator n=2 Tax=Streptomyces rapamycinicus TaxID=1226757 RepID=A0A0A0N451_STRRN|nr:TetR/AcrR family transcriptional regulator [Streptomyces rapamycinicus]AGP53227.1 TetR family transcriptional regulator [Streptomyces rapamycinicus NRRL 5491]MBB4780713.1 TetR/AcrR family transcriptional repressor of nem operon [Streptomyces rapamycinicus]RLV74638.1 TetR family transcriptional regulator [Streptomyces rapamycinicus NRRL 5491]UTO61415.1 TetR/AcrR family transcriptional regulator [Streptomyces rapamycinicus]UTP29362.1 TetR/AcrR family transcriptional regulator [Streptomyces ra
MGRVSQAQAEENRRRVVETASRLFREQGTHVSVTDLMKAAGLTHGGFYKQFASKEALIDEATAHAFDGLTRLRDGGLKQHGGQRDAAQQELIDTYLSVEHRDSAADGCPAAALAADMAREPGDREARRVYTEGVGEFAEWLATEDQDGITRLCTMLGALVLARATKDSPLSEQILTAAHAALTTTS